MNVALWAEIRRLSEIERLSQRVIAQRLRCSRRTVKRALAMDRPPAAAARLARSSLLDPYRPQIDALLAKYPKLSAVRILEELRRGPEGYRGGISLIRRYVRQVRPAGGRVYQEVVYQPGEALQVDWGDCGRIQVANTLRRVYVLVAVLCYSRLGYIEFSLTQRKADFYRAIVHALEFFGGSPRKIIFDNLKAAVLNGHGRSAYLHPEFLALCGHFDLEPIACARRDPESKGVVEAGVRYVKHNALQGRSEELTRWEDYPKFAVRWRDDVANLRLHQTTRERPVDRFEKERLLLRPLPGLPFDTDEVVSAIVSPLARIQFDGNRYSTPPDVTRQTVIVRATPTHVRVIYQGREVAEQHVEPRLCPGSHERPVLLVKACLPCCFLWRLGPDALTVHVQGEGRVAHFGQFVRAHASVVAKPHPFMHDQYAGAVALDGLIPGQVALQNRVAVPVFDDFGLHCAANLCCEERRQQHWSQEPHTNLPFIP